MVLAAVYFVYAYRLFFRSTGRPQLAGMPDAGAESTGSGREA